MAARTRTASPGRAKEAKERDEAGKSSEDRQNEGKVAFKPPPRPDLLRKEVFTLHVVLAGVVYLFWVLGESMIVLQPVPAGKFMLKKKTFIDIEDFNATELGPFPKCHPHFGEHEQILADGTRQWVKNDVQSDGPFLAGHPENPEWLKKSHEEQMKDNLDNRFTWIGLQPNLHLLMLANAVVYLGSKHSVWLFTESENREASPVLKSEDAYWFPVMGSLTLFGMFLVLKYFGTDLVKTLITCAVVTMCSFGLGTNISQVVNVARDKAYKPLFTIPVIDEKVTSIELGGVLLGAGMSVLYMSSKNWIINNIFGVSFSLLGIKVIGISSFKTGAIMLSGLFFYDVFWVFGSKSVFGANVMVSVAKGIDAPIKLLFPRSLSGCGTLLHSMLGLGDIVVPGIFISFLAKWDAVKLGEKKMTSWVYLNTTMVAYALSLVTTVSIMLFFNHAQPALLYIVPYVLLTSLAVAVRRGELKELWDFVIPDESELAKPSDAKKEE